MALPVGLTQLPLQHLERARKRERLGAELDRLRNLVAGDGLTGVADDLGLGDVGPLMRHDDGVNLDEILEGIERQYLVLALEQTNGNRTEAAKLLNISFRSIRYRLRKFGFDD